MQTSDNRHVPATKPPSRTSKFVVLVLAVALPLAAIILANGSTGSNTSQGDTDAGAVSNATLMKDGQARCLGEASDRYSSDWKAADKDGDGKLTYSDGATDITTSYHDSQIMCYQVWKTDDSQSHITDLQAKRQQEVDTHNTWVSSQSNSTQSNRQPLSCTTNTIGSYTYTNCY